MKLPFVRELLDTSRHIWYRGDMAARALVVKASAGRNTGKMQKPWRAQVTRTHNADHENEFRGFGDDDDEENGSGRDDEEDEPLDKVMTNRSRMRISMRTTLPLRSRLANVALV